MRYIIGIDLGTTNSCVSYVDTESTKKSIQPLNIPQLIGTGFVDSLPTLPSFCYLSTPNEWPEKALNLPWSNENSIFIGRFAQQQGAKVPTKLIQSAKSWLCHPSANRKDKILPIEAADESQRISPLTATVHYLAHIKNSWNHLIANGDPLLDFEEQEIILTVPASFDEVARALTVEAAKLAGYKQMTLLEEPQAAFYAWISHNENSWQKKLKPNDYILVCDVGGGTTDFSLMHIESKETELSIQRMAVGNHLLLGGDNMDAALTHLLEQKLREKEPTLSELNNHQWLQLKHEARRAKETLLDPHGKLDTYSVVLQGTGSSIIKGSYSLEISRKEVESFLLTGFFGTHDWNQALVHKRGSGIRSMGLPYEEEPSITKHLASFLKRATPKDLEQIKPNYVLFNGGTMQPLAFQNAVVDNLKKWFPDINLQILPSPHLDLSVGRGASYYGKVRRGLGTVIKGGSARGYYLAVSINNKNKTLTLLPRGSEEGTSYKSPEEFFLTPNTPISFQLYTSNVRLYDQSGDIVEVNLDEMNPLPPIQTVLRFGKQSSTNDKIPVTLSVLLTPIGTFQLWLESTRTGHKWELEFQMRAATGLENTLIDQSRKDELFDLSLLAEAKKILEDAFQAHNKTGLKKINENLEALLVLPKKEWPLSVLRGLFDSLIKVSNNRTQSVDQETKWWNLCGFLLRPGYGYPLDDFRIKELWKIVLADVKVSKPLDTQIQQIICFRRVAGGFNRGQQIQLYSTYLTQLTNKKFEFTEIKNKSELYPYSEKIRLLGSLELIDNKSKLGESLLNKIMSKIAIPVESWALARIGARHLVYGTISHIIPKADCERWIANLLEVENEESQFVLSQLSRKTDQREINISEELLKRVHSKYPSISIDEQQILSSEQQDRIYGEQLPLGLSLEKQY